MKRWARRSTEERADLVALCVAAYRLGDTATCDAIRRNIGRRRGPSFEAMYSLAGLIVASMPNCGHPDCAHPFVARLSTAASSGMHLGAAVLAAKGNGDADGALLAVQGADRSDLRPAIDFLLVLAAARAPRPLPGQAR
ncbi:MAG: hypothetical protein JWM89_1825 [Acidimicrobiales bacterium]|nr:hypothetical protein [Acidimicrobiales bacterium]